MKRKLMILGAGIFQVAAIKKAVELGYYVITVDNIPDNIGHNYSHESINLSTADAEKVIKSASKKQIDGIYAMASDVALPTVAKVAEALSLPGPDVKYIYTILNKITFRSLQKKLKMDSPQFIEVRDFNKAVTEWQGGPAIIKPAMSSGSRGVSMLEQMDVTSHAYYKSALKLSNNNCVCLEEFIDGQDVSVEGFILNNKVRYAFISKKYIHNFAVIGHELPNNISGEIQNNILDQIQKVVDSGIVSNGPFDADFRIGEGRVVLLEIAPRLGGNGLPVLVEAAYGISLIELSLKYAMDEPSQILDIELEENVVPHVSILLYPERTGTVESLSSEESIISKLDKVEELCINLVPGQKVDRFVHGGHVFGYCILNMIEGIGFNKLAEQVKSAISIQYN
ncbi:acetyl-CoA carboxylase biotin carboxylase subunit family protein [Candidatus Thiodiazotropha sp. LNASS1]|uniref:ATP-grasp domain-containing protein n=1 Tax=Candidatus Thiodiazotropha sp. LNASS1 TaxID=3096260 RepID=UPI0034E03AA5